MDSFLEQYTLCAFDLYVLFPKSRTMFYVHSAQVILKAINHILWTMTRTNLERWIPNADLMKLMHGTLVVPPEIDLPKLSSI